MVSRLPTNQHPNFSFPRRTISNANTCPTTGFSIPKFLPQNNADLSATSYNGTTYIYHPSNIGELGIRELVVSGVPASLGSFFQESYNISEPLVARPTLTSLEGTSPYSPVAAGVTSANGTSQGPQLFVFWADKVRGGKPADEGSVTGYASLQQISRPVGNATWNDNERLTIPLGSSNTYPSPSSRLRRWMSWI